MSSSEIEKVIHKIKNNIVSGTQEITNVSQDNINSSDKKKLLELIKKAKKINKQKEDELDNSSEESSEKPKRKVKFADEKVNKSKKVKLISINAEEHTEPEYFSDYMVDLPDKYKNVTGIEVLDYNFPKDLCKINKNNNQLEIIMDGEEKLIELEDGEYSIDEIIDGLQSAFDDNNMALSIDIDNDEHIVLSSTDKEFSFKNEENSLGKILGFTEDEYKDDRVYKSENKYSLVSKIYLYIENISPQEPFGIIDLKSNKKNPLIKHFNQPISEIKEMILKFKRRPTDEDDLVNFSNKPHKLTFKIESKN